MKVKGVDTIEYKLYLKVISNELIRDIGNLRDAAHKDKIEKDILLEGEHFKLSFITGKYYRLILRNENMVISLMDNFSDKNYSIKVKLSSKFLWTNGYINAYKKSLTLVENLVKTSTIKEKKLLTRLDFCFDSDEIRFVDSDYKGFVTRARKVKKHYDRENKKFKLTGYEIGKRSGDLFLRIYNKTLELEESKKYWFKDIWENKNWKENEGKEIWRVEFQIKKKALNELRVFTTEDFIEKEKGIWKYLTTKWFKIKSRRNKNNYNSIVKGKWKKVQKSVNLETEKVIVRKPYRIGDENSHLNQILGNVTSLAALQNNYDQEDIFKKILKHSKQEQIRKKESFEETVKKKQEQI